MKLKVRAKLILCGLLSVVTVSALGALSRAVHADDSDNDYVMAVSPATQQIGNMEPGTEMQGKFKVMNNGNKHFNYKIETKGYKITDQNYNFEYTGEGTYTMISKWVTFSQDEGGLDAGEEIEITYKVKVPENAPAGGQYGAIVVSTTSGENGEMIKANGEIGVLLLSRVAGETVNCAKIHEANMNTFLVNPPVTATSLVENCGNVDVNAEYILRVFPLFSDEEIYTNEDNPDKQIVFPETKRFVNQTWPQSASFGIFKVEQVIRIGDQEQTLSKLVVICPIWLIIIILLFIGAVIFWLVSRRRERKENKSAKSKTE